MRCIPYLHDSTIRRDPAGLWLSPHQFEIVKTVDGCALDHSVCNFGPPWDSSCRAQYSFVVCQLRPGLCFFSVVLCQWVSGDGSQVFGLAYCVSQSPGHGFLSPFEYDMGSNSGHCEYVPWLQ
jgi:hypothetical protein